MEVIIVIVIAGVVSVLAASFLLKARALKKWGAVFSEAAKLLGLAFTAGDRSTAPVLSGSVREFPTNVSIEEVRQGRSTVLAIAVRVGFPRLRAPIVVTPEGLLKRIGWKGGPSDVLFNDDDFDALAKVEGEPIHDLRAMFNRRVRSAVADLIRGCVAGGFKLTDSSLETRQKSEGCDAPDSLAALVNRIVGLAADLSRPGSTARLLAENFLEEKSAAG